MNVTMRAPMTMAQFLAWEERQDLKHEFDGIAPQAMSGGTVAHAAIQRNLAFSITGRLRGKPCQFYGSDLKIEVAGSIRYPDGIVVCTPLAPGIRVVSEPVVIFEILSESTGRTDLTIKNREYAATPSVMRYVILEQDAIAGTEFARVGDDWVGHILNADSILRMPEIGIDCPLAELYDGLDLQARAEA